MRQVNRIDLSTGMYIEPVILQGTEEAPTDCVETPCPSGFYWPKWDGSAWVEGGTAPAPVTTEPTTDERLASVEAAITALMGV